MNGTVGSPAEAVSCESCPSFASSPMGSLSFENCFCLPGYFGLLGEIERDLDPLDDDNSTTTTHNGTCVACPANAQSARGALGLDECLCSPGWYGSPVDNVSCVACPGMATSPLGSQTKADCRCVAGYYGAPGRNVTCLPCAANSHSIEGSQFPGNCSCNAGYYGDPGASGDGACSACPAGKYQPLSDQVAASSCLNCTARSSSPAASPAVSYCLCDPGSYGDPGSSGTCNKCPRDTFGPLLGQTTSDSCLSCQPNAVTLSTGASASSDCVCDAGFYSVIAVATDLSVSCVPCPAGTYGTTAGTTPLALCVAVVFFLMPCAIKSSFIAHVTGRPLTRRRSLGLQCAGYTQVGQCSRCPAGGFSAPGSDTLLDCVCRAGMFTNSTTRECTDCPPGTFAAEANPLETCTTCVINAGSEQGSTACACDPGYYGGANATSPCEACPANFYNPVRGATSSSACVSCPTFSESTAASTDLDACVCAPGFFGLPRAGIVCHPCPTNTSQPSANVTNSSLCLACDGNALTPSGSASCAT